MTKSWRQTAVLMILGVTLWTTQPAHAAIVTAGSLLVDLDASGLSTGTLTTWTNAGTAGGSFNNNVGTTVVQNNVGVSGVKAVTFGSSGNSRLASTFNVNPTVSGITGNSGWSTEAWVYNPAVGLEEIIFEWADRGGPNGTYAYTGYGTSNIFGAAAHWGAPDMGFAGVPAAGQWHHLAVTFDGATEHVYVNGVLNATEAKTLAIKNDARPIHMGLSHDGAAAPASFSIAQARIHDDALAAAGVTNNYNEHAGLFGRALVAPATAAATWTNAGTGNWATGGNWDIGTAPSAANATINNGGTAILNSSIPSILALNVNNNSQVQHNAGAALQANTGLINSGSTYAIDGGFFTIANGNLDVGRNSLTPAFFNQSGGLVNLAGGARDLVIGFNGVGTYNLSGGVYTGDWTIVGEQGAGNGTFNLSGGNATFQRFTVGFINAVGKFTATGGSLTVNGPTFIGENNGTGTFQVVGGGSTLDFNGGFAMNANSNLDFTIVNGGISLIDVLGVATLDGNLSLDFSGGVNGTYTLLTAQGGIVDNGFNFDFNGGSWTYAIVGAGGGPQSLEVSVLVPEPSSLVLAGLGIVGMAVVYRRRRRQGAGK